MFIYVVPSVIIPNRIGFILLLFFSFLSFYFCRELSFVLRKGSSLIVVNGMVITIGVNGVHSASIAKFVSLTS